DLHLCCHWRKTQTYRHANRNPRANFHQACPWCKTFRIYTETVDTKSKIVHHVTAVDADLKCPAKLISVAHQFDFRRNGSPLRVPDVDVQFAPGKLCVRSLSSKKDERKHGQRVTNFYKNVDNQRPSPQPVRRVWCNFQIIDHGSLGF